MQTRTAKLGKGQLFSTKANVISAMNPTRKARTPKKHKQSRTWIAVACVLLLVTVAAVAYIWQPFKSAPVNNAEKVPVLPAAAKPFTDHYLGIMENLNSTETKAKMSAQLDPKFNQTDLFSWQQGKMTFADDPAGWLEDPMAILNSGKGICAQWSIVYVSACLALGYQSRLVVSVDTSTWTFIHVWAEDYYNGTWVHVDPSDKVWNNPSRYLGWDWGKGIGSSVRIFAFEDGRFEEVTSNYGPNSS